MSKAIYFPYKHRCNVELMYLRFEFIAIAAAITSSVVNKLCSNRGLHSQLCSGYRAKKQEKNFMKEYFSVLQVKSISLFFFLYESIKDLQMAIGITTVKYDRNIYRSHYEIIFILCD